MPKNKKKTNKNNKKVVKKVQVIEEVDLEKENAEVVEEVKEVKKEEVKTNKKNNKKPEKKLDKEAKKQKRWFKDFKAELKKMVWPSGKELWENTVVVLSSVILVALIIFALDSAFNGLSKLEVEGVKKIQNSISDEENIQGNEVIEETANNEVALDTTTEESK